VATSSLPCGISGIIGRQLVFDLSVAAFLDAEHFLNLVPHRIVVLEIECRERTDLETTVSL